MARSRQRKHGGGKFKSERQRLRRWMWKFAPRAAKKWAHNRKTRKSDWARTRSGARRRRR